MEYIIKSCPVCGASELKKTGVEEKDGQLFGVYKCPCCDAVLSAYDKYVKEVKAEKNKTSEVSKGAASKNSPLDRKTIVNVAADVYKKSINTTLGLAAKINDYTMVGTGTIVSDNGYFVTNAHVVMQLSDNRKTIVNLSDEVYGESGEDNYRFTADVVYVNPTYDLALLRTEPEDALVPVDMSDEEIMIGEAVYVIGNSKGEGLCITEGIVSDLHRQVGGREYILITAPVAQGNSGGPVFNAEGKLIGIVKGGRSDVSAMNYVIPIETLKAFLLEAKEKENIEI